jgi:ATP-dependent DNA helicase DinG
LGEEMKQEPGSNSSSLASDSRLFMAGAVKHALHEYEPRPSQVTMMERCAKVIESGGMLLAEAGTGTGKTFAYLIPAILSGQKTLVTTRTINLQEQLGSKDLGFLASLRVFDYAIAKGRGHFLCRRRLDAFQPSDKVERNEYRNMREWISETETGDIEGYTSRKKPGIWERIHCDADACKGRMCSYYGHCYYFAARRRWTNARVIVTNHALLAINAMMPVDSRILPQTDILVIDEAHALDTVFSDQIGVTLSDLGCNYLMNRLLKSDARGHYKGLLGKSPVLFPVIESLRLETGLFWQRVRKEVESRTLIRGSFPVKDSLLSLAGDFHTLIDAIRKSSVGLFEAEDEEIEIKAVMTKILKLCTDMETFAGEVPGFVRWAETEENKTSLRMSPVYPSDFIVKSLLPEYDAVILTSATLSLGGDFSLIEKTLGVRHSEKLSVPSPFDLGRQVSVEVRKGIDLRDEHSIKVLARVIIEESAKEEGGTLVLFTSKEVMRKTWDLSADTLRESGLHPIRQGDLPNSKMLDIMRRSRNTVIYGLDSFWEGVDVRGDSLKTIIITKLPFEVPTEPIVQARTELIERHGGNAFLEYSLPRAVLKYRQGFGRLIRSKTDTGRIILCDERVFTRKYGKIFSESIQ